MKNAKGSKLDIRALATRKNGDREQVSDTLTAGEKVQVAVMVEKLNGLQTQLAQIQGATSELITTIVVSRGLDPKKYGVNLAAGKILPVGPVAPVAPEVPQEQS